MVALFTLWCTSVLQIPGAKDVAIKFYSLFKSYNMAGWRAGCVVGIKGLAQVKTNVDSGVFKVIQDVRSQLILLPLKQNSKP